MLKILKESVEKLPRSGFVHLLYICKNANGLKFKILKGYRHSDHLRKKLPFSVGVLHRLPLWHGVALPKYRAVFLP